MTVKVFLDVCDKVTKSHNDVSVVMCLEMFVTWHCGELVSVYVKLSDGMTAFHMLHNGELVSSVNMSHD